MKSKCIGKWVLALAIWLVQGAIIYNGGWNAAERKADADIAEIQKAANEACEKRLAEPHHCISVCEEQFTKWGC